jgi:glyceraldehyde 3-phosphate dehydrogenase
MKIAINGFGRIGRLAARIILERDHLELVGINDLASIDYLVYLLKHDSTHGKFNKEISVEENALLINGKRITKPEIAKNPIN